MNRITSLGMIALFLAGCASRSVPPAATAARAPLAEPARSNASAAASVELRHFYLLSPGPSAKLVVTRSDVAPREAGRGDLAAGDR